MGVVNALCRADTRTDEQYRGGSKATLSAGEEVSEPFVGFAV